MKKILLYALMLCSSAAFVTACGGDDDNPNDPNNPNNNTVSVGGPELRHRPRLYGVLR